MKKHPPKRRPARVLATSMPTALYKAVKDHVRGRIRSGHWKPGDRIASEHELVAALGVSRMTVNRALRELAAGGEVVRLVGIGTFVGEEKPQSGLLRVAKHRRRDQGQGPRLCVRRRAGRARIGGGGRGGGARAGPRRPRLPLGLRPPRERRADPARGSLRQPQGRPALPVPGLHSDTTRGVPPPGRSPRRGGARRGRRGSDRTGGAAARHPFDGSLPGADPADVVGRRSRHLGAVHPPRAAGTDSGRASRRTRRRPSPSTDSSGLHARSGLGGADSARRRAARIRFLRSRRLCGDSPHPGAWPLHSGIRNCPDRIPLLVYNDGRGGVPCAYVSYPSS